MARSNSQSARLLDFDEGMRLARTDPAAFEKHRRAVIEAFIGQVPAHRQPRLRGLQWRIDLERERAPNPMAACVRIQEMMWESFAGPGGLAEVFRNGPPAAPATTRAKVLEFPSRGHPAKSKK